MLMIRGIIIVHLVSFCIAANTTKKISFKTGNKLAVLRFEGSDISDPLIEHLTEELRQSIRDLKIFNVQNRDITDDVHINGMTMVTKSLLKSGQYASGTTVEPAESWRRNQARFKSLDNTLKNFNRDIGGKND